MSASKPGEGLDETTPPDVVLRTPGGVEEGPYMGADSRSQTCFEGIETIFHILSQPGNDASRLPGFPGLQTLEALF
jgi:hypothetical protein